MRTGFALLACLLLWPATLAAQQPSTARDPRTFRAGVEAVEIDVRVVDERGNPVTGLTRDDFELFEEGRRQEIATFTSVDVPRVAPRTAALEADTASNRVPFDGRIYVLVLDDLHTQPLHAARVRHVVRRFLDEHLAANDRAALLVTSGRADASQELTASRRALLAALDRFHGRKLRSSTLERIDQYYMTRDLREGENRNDGRGARIDDPLEFERGYNARVALDTLAKAAQWLGTVPARRKALLFISEGIDYDIHDPIENREASAILSGARDAITMATRGNVTIYGIDPRGLTVDGGEGIEVASLPEDTSLNLGTTSMTRELQRSQDSLRVLSDETGGFAIVNANDLAGGFERIVRDNTSYYLLGYQPGNRRRDGKFRRVEVRVRKPGVRVLARKGYVAPTEQPDRRAEAREETAPDLRRLLDSPIPVSGLTLHSAVAAFRGANGKASALVALEVEPGLTFQEGDGVHRGRVDVSALAISSDGKVYGGDQRAIEMKLKPELLAHVNRHGFRTLSRLELPPGRYQIRVAAREQGSSQEGSVVHDLVVPDFAAAPLAMSHLVLASRGAAQALTTKPDAQLQDRLPLPPTAARAFDPRDTVTVFAELYDNRSKGAEGLIVTTTLSDAGGKAAFRMEEHLEAASAESARTHRVEIPLHDMAPGPYVLKVEARARTAGGVSVSREVPVEVLPRRDTTM